MDNFWGLFLGYFSHLWNIIVPILVFVIVMGSMYIGLEKPFSKKQAPEKHPYNPNSQPERKQECLRPVLSYGCNSNKQKDNKKTPYSRNQILTLNSVGLFLAFLFRHICIIRRLATKCKQNLLPFSALITSCPPLFSMVSSRYRFCLLSSAIKIFICSTYIYFRNFSISSRKVSGLMGFSIYPLLPTFSILSLSPVIA